MNDFRAEPIAPLPIVSAEEKPERGAMASFVGICVLAVSAASLTLGVTAADRSAAPLSGHWHLRAPHGAAGPMQAMLGEVAGCGEASAVGRSVGADAESMPIDAVMALLQKT